MNTGMCLPGSVGSVPAALAWWASATPDAPALIVPGLPAVSYADLRNRVQTYARLLARYGVQCRDCVITLLADESDHAVAFLGAASVAIAMPLDPLVTVADIEQLLPRVRVTAAIVDSGLAPEVRHCLDQAGVAVIVGMTDGRGADPARAFDAPNLGDAGPTPDAGDLAVIGQTSGTTGKPKLIPRGHGDILAAGQRHRDLFELTPADRVLASAPMSLILGRSALLHTIVAGASIVYPPSREPNEIAEVIASHRPTWMHAAAGFLELLAQAFVLEPCAPGSSFRFIRVTAAPIAPATCAILEEQLGAPVLSGFSTSETGIVATELSRPGWRKPGSVGKPIQDLRLVDGDGRDVRTGEAGEVWVRGEEDCREYLDDLQLNARAFTADGWYCTGDIGYLDAHGFLFLTGRLSDLINRGGAKVSPEEVEHVLSAHPAVAHAAAFAVPDERLREDIAAAVVLKTGAGASARELRGWMLVRLARYKVPRHIVFVSPGELPRTTSGKVRRGELARRWMESHP